MLPDYSPLPLDRVLGCRPTLQQRRLIREPTGTTRPAADGRFANVVLPAKHRWRRRP